MILALMKGAEPMKGIFKAVHVYVRAHTQAQ